MADSKNFDVIIIGGSYAGLSAAMALGRSLRHVLVIDGGKPCNIQTPHSHNFITQDGETPKAIADKAKVQVLTYETVKFLKGTAISGAKIIGGYQIQIENGNTFTAKKLLFATGITDLMPDMKGFAECWGISVLHCPYCHGYEVRQQEIGLLGNGEAGFEMSRLLSNWSKQLTLLTNGKSTLTAQQTEKLHLHNIAIIESEIEAFEHTKGTIQHIIFRNGARKKLSAVFAKVNFKQHCDIPQALGCAFTEQGFIKTDDFQRTNIPGVFAAGDNTTMFRAVSVATAAGTKAGAVINKELIDEDF